MSQTRDQQRLAISEVAADWHEPMWRLPTRGVPGGVTFRSLCQSSKSLGAAEM